MIYPNPVKEQFSIETNQAVETIKLYNASGRLVKIFNKQDKYSINGLQSGGYFVNIQSKDNILVQSLIIE